MVTNAGMQIKELVENAGGVDRVSALSGVSDRDVTHWIEDGNRPRYSTVVKVCPVLGCTVEEFAAMYRKTPVISEA